MKPSFYRFAAGAIAAASIVSAAVAAQISGAGATFPAPIYAKWAGAYQGVSHTSLNYQPIGSGGGIKQIQAKTVTFGASDMPMKTADLNKYGLLQFPTVIGGVVPVVNIPGVKPDQLVLDGATLAAIYMGKISNWSDPAIKRLNPSVNLPNKAIAVVHRSDGSGTTFIFTHYLSQVSQDWANGPSEATAVDWPVGIGAKGNEGVAGNVAQTAYSIGYVEYAYAKQNHLTHTRMVNRGGKTVSPTAAAFAAAAAGAQWDAGNGFYVLLTNQPGDATWPIAGATFILVYKQPSDQAATAETLRFFKWAYQNGDAMASSLDYVPLPDAVVAKIEASWSQVQGWAGH